MAATTASALVQTVTRTVAASASPSSTLRVAAQGGILEHGNPAHYDKKNPIITFIIQAGIIILFCRMLHWPLKRLRQPRVIAEVIGGILLGPSVMGRIPGFSANIFPTEAMPNLNLVANIGLVLFLFLVGLEVDLRYLVTNWKIAASVGLAGMTLPFGLGAAIAWGIHQDFKDEPDLVPISFGVFMLFVGVAMAITAFPVLCRILVELKLLHTPVGVIVLSAGVGNDVVGWVLLALCVALVNSGTGLSALYVLLTCIAWVLFMAYAVRPAFLWVLRRTHSLENGPPQSIIALTLLICLTSSFFTGVIGVHPIFGAFLAGLICPHEGGFAIKVTEKIEDLVSALFLPLYFALSGLSTDIGLLNDGLVWGYVVGIIAVAFISKFFGAAIAARLNGLVWRECFTIGSLMSCKGLVELIVLNIGLQAKILSTRTFTMFVIMALVTTFATTPMTAALYPPWYQKKLEAWKRGEIDWDTGKAIADEAPSTRDSLSYEKIQIAKVRKILVYLRLDNMPPLLTLLATLGGSPQAAKSVRHPHHFEGTSSQATVTVDLPAAKPIEAHGLRLLELTERASSVMQVSEVEEYSTNDPLVNTLRTVGTMHNIAVSGEVNILPEGRFSDALATQAHNIDADLMLLPWSETGSINESQTITSEGLKRKLTSSSFADFMLKTLTRAPCNTAVLVNKNFGGSSAQPQKPAARPGLFRSKSGQSISSGKEIVLAAPIRDRTHHVFCPFLGGADDRCALRLVLQLAENSEVTATVVHFETEQDFWTSADDDGGGGGAAATLSTSQELKKGGRIETTLRMASPPGQRDVEFFLSLKSSIPPELAGRVVFESHPTRAPVRDVLERAALEVGQNPHNNGDLIVLGRSISRLSSLSRASEQPGADVVQDCLGGLGTELVRSSLRASVMVVQSSDGSFA